MARTAAQQAIRAVARRVASGELTADQAAARVAAIRDAQAIAVYRAALEVAAPARCLDFPLLIIDGGLS